jgi:hypothetical protein
MMDGVTRFSTRWRAQENHQTVKKVGEQMNGGRI